MTLLLAEIDSKLWFYLIFAAVSVLGGIFGKKKKDQQKQPQQTRAKPVTRPPTPKVRAPTPPRPGRSAPTTPPPPRRASVAAPRPTPMARVPAQPPVARRAPIPQRARPATPTPQPPPVKRPRQTSAAEPQRAVEPSKVAQPTEQPRVTKHKPRPRRTKRRLHSRTSRIQHVLLNRSGLRSAIILSEILAPPIAMREQQLP